MTLNNPFIPIAGTGITKSGKTYSVDQGFSPTWTGQHTFANTMLAQNIVPRATDTYDLGSSTVLWRKGYLSELDAVLFAENTITLLGGWFYVTKDQGTFPSDITAAASTIDFGKAMTVGDFVVMRSSLQVEYIQVGTLVSGTTYNVTRNLDGSGANDWPAGTPFAVLGQSGSGRIELNAYDTPRISLIDQGATYNAQTERMRIGDLNGNWGYTAQTFGTAIGAYGAGKTSLTVDNTNGIRIFNGTTQVGQWDTSGNILVGQATAGQSNVLITSGAVKFRNNTTDLIVLGTDGTITIGQVAASQSNILISAGKISLRNNTTEKIVLNADGTSSFEGVMNIGTSGGIYQGTGTFASPNTGLKIYNSGGIGLLEMWGSDGAGGWTKQVYAGTDGKLYAGGGNTVLDSSGLTLTAGSVTVGNMSPSQLAKWSDISGIVGQIGASRYYGAEVYNNVIEMRAKYRYYNGESYYGTVSLLAEIDATPTAVGIGAGLSMAWGRYVSINATSSGIIRLIGNVYAYNGLNVGTATGAGTGEIKASGMLNLGTAAGGSVGGIQCMNPSGPTTIRGYIYSNTTYAQYLVHDEVGIYRSYYGYIGSNAGLGTRNDCVELGTNGKPLTLRPSETEMMRLISTGVGIGGIAPSYTLDVNGTIHYTTLTASSDKRFKKNVERITGALDIIKQINGVRFEWNERINRIRNGYKLRRPTLGVIGQEVEKVLPEVIEHWRLDDEITDACAVSYERMIPVLIEAIKELEIMIWTLQQKLSPSA